MVDLLAGMSNFRTVGSQRHLQMQGPEVLNRRSPLINELPEDQNPQTEPVEAETWVRGVSSRSTYDVLCGRAVLSRVVRHPNLLLLDPELVDPPGALVSSA